MVGIAIMDSNNTLNNTTIPPYSMKDYAEQEVCRDCHEKEPCGCENIPVRERMFSDDGMINDKYFDTPNGWCEGCKLRRYPSETGRRFCNSCEWDMSCMLRERMIQRAGDKQMNNIQDELNDIYSLDTKQVDLYTDEHTVDDIIDIIQKFLRENNDYSYRDVLLRIILQLSQLQEMGYRRWRREHESSLTDSRYGF